MDTRCVQGLDDLPDAARGCVLTVGNFDGVHLGHRRILDDARRLADAEGTAAVAMTFDPPPDLVLRPDDQPQRITPAAQRADLLLAAGADYVVTARTDARLLGLSPEAFIAEIIMSRFAPLQMVEGANFFYGKRRAGNIQTLRRAGRTHNFAVHVADPVAVDLGEGPVPVSSTLIRRLLLDGRVERAARCLGRDFVLYGRVTGGERRGRALAYPTANIDPGEQVTPGDGIYAGRAAVRGADYPAAISVGDKPTFGPGERTVETFLLDADGDFYNEPLALSFVRRLRDQEKFADGEALRAQIAGDVERVREICRQ